jgi:hypothetical protein
MRLGNYMRRANINALQHAFFLALGRSLRRLGDLSRIIGSWRAGSHRQRKPMMPLKMRLNVLAAIVSFVFLTAIVLGMF